MKYPLDFSFWYEGQIVKVWDYSPRNKLYTLIGIEDESGKLQLKQQDIDIHIENTTKFWAQQIVKNIFHAKREVENWSASYGNRRDLGNSMVNAYNRGLFTSPHFYKYIIEEIRKVEEPKKIMCYYGKG
ncbi:hypothetical protein HFZ78_13450 [Priestia megaterium]|uniref:Uncharacterized protein n=1 Tax=Priestia megaterium TaxID=1404 RepID=A0A6H1P236_PRIMG|nr:hypothetical protein [Priestia megaterium]QIZ07613.1 hypothetical protein HFZ78_13450 [Priestia megaterium]